MSDHMVVVLQDLHEQTWFSMELLEGITTSVRGCTAGNPVADLIYIACDTLLAKELHATLRAEGLAVEMSDADALSFFGVLSAPCEHQLSRIAYVDDGAIPILAPACSILDRLSRVASVCKFTYESFGLSINFAPGKTEAVIAFNGPGAQAVRCELFNDRCGCVSCEGIGAATFELRVVPKYRHLGGMISGSGDMSGEILPKIAIVRQTARSLRKPFLRDPKVPK